MSKLSKPEITVLCELEAAPDNQIRSSTFQSCASGLGIHPRQMRLVVGRLVKAGMVEELPPCGSDMPHYLKLTPEGARSLTAIAKAEGRTA